MLTPVQRHRYVATVTAKQRAKPPKQTQPVAYVIYYTYSHWDKLESTYKMLPTAPCYVNVQNRIGVDSRKSTHGIIN